MLLDSFLNSEKSEQVVASLSASREYLKQGLFKLLKGYGYLEGTGEEYDEERDMYTIVYAPVRRWFVFLRPFPNPKTFLPAKGLCRAPDQLRVRCETQRLCLAKLIQHLFW